MSFINFMFNFIVIRAVAVPPVRFLDPNSEDFSDAHKGFFSDLAFFRRSCLPQQMDTRVL